MLMRSDCLQCVGSIVKLVRGCLSTCSAGDVIHVYVEWDIIEAHFFVQVFVEHDMIMPLLFVDYASFYKCGH